MKYSVEYVPKVIKQLRKMDAQSSRLLLQWINKNIVHCEDPRSSGKALTGNYSGFWRYRVGQFRIITKIEDDKLIILVISIDHRKNIYR
ncbi:Toxin RelG [Macrococcoides canis]|uniref:Toxin RelG n=1 Tax=Macrococcoides canis TaxID=1855823 RepID=A0A1W7ABD4_9STAP|nr:type II toxin-antitoxin system RelE/ParE family toxin [Macrococcus canis]ARQ06854.1 Toxin RelG [Macrococcus canis]